MTRALAFDIETYGSWEGLAPHLQEYLQRRDRDRGVVPEDPRSAAQSVSLLPGLARVVAIGLWEPSAPDAPRAPDTPAAPLASALALDPTQAEPERALALPGGATARCFREEAALLRAFWAAAGAVVAGGGRLVSFHGRGFDGPMLLVRSAVLGVVPTVALAGRSRSLHPHCDVSEALNFFGATRMSLSLDYWCAAFGIRSPKQNGFTGRDVGAAFERGEHAAIAAYARDDARATGELYQRLEATFLPLLLEPAPGP